MCTVRSVRTHIWRLKIPTFWSLFCASSLGIQHENSTSNQPISTNAQKKFCPLSLSLPLCSISISHFRVCAASSCPNFLPHQAFRSIFTKHNCFVFWWFLYPFYLIKWPCCATFHETHTNVVFKTHIRNRMSYLRHIYETDTKWFLFRVCLVYVS